MGLPRFGTGERVTIKESKKELFQFGALYGYFPYLILLYLFYIYFLSIPLQDLTVYNICRDITYTYIYICIFVIGAFIQFIKTFHPAALAEIHITYT